MAPDAEIHTLAVPYALHALDGDEAALFEQHLSVCASCQSEVDEVRETVARLGTSAATPVPAELKARVMNEIGTMRPLPPLVAAGEPEISREEPGFRRWFPRLVAVAAVAATAVAVALGLELRDTRLDLDEAAQHSAEMSEVLASSDLQVVRSDANGSGSTVIMSRSKDAAMVMVEGMAAPPSGQVYQLWLMEDVGARPAGVMANMDHGGMAGAAHGLAGATSLGITLEPAGGSEQPTSDPLMMIELPA